MSPPHSILWHYLWIAPNVYLAVLAFLMYRRRLYKEWPAFYVYALYEAVSNLVLYALDVSPSVTGSTYWTASFALKFPEAAIKFWVIGEVFKSLLRSYPALSRLGRLLVTVVGTLLVFTATGIAAYSATASSPLIAATRILGRSLGVVQTGLILSVVLFAARFNLTWIYRAFGIVVGVGVSACSELINWALVADHVLGNMSYVLDVFVLAMFHVCVLIWMYYLLVPEKRRAGNLQPEPLVRIPDHELEAWNRELEQFLHK